MARTSFAMAVVTGTLLLVNAPAALLGQPLTVTGRVTNYFDLQPIPGVLVFVQGDSLTQVLTDTAGRFSIVIPQPDATLVFSALGYARQVESPEGRTVLNVNMEPEALQLDEIVVVGYGQQNRAIISGRAGSAGGQEAASGTIPCDGAALESPPALEPREEPRRMPPPDPVPTPIPNACAAPAPGGGAGAR